MTPKLELDSTQNFELKTRIGLIYMNNNNDNKNIKFDNDIITAAADVMNNDDVTNYEDEVGQEVDDNAFPEPEAAKKDRDKDEEDNFDVLRPTAVEKFGIRRHVGIMSQDIIAPVANIGMDSKPTQNEI